MSAVLARKQAEPLMAALVERGNVLRRKEEAGQDFAGKVEWQSIVSNKVPAPVARLVQCFVEEAEAAPETLIAALQLTAFFAKGCRSTDDWRALSRGPYAEELLHQAWSLYAPMQCPSETWLLQTCASLMERRYPETYWDGGEGQTVLQRLLSSQSAEEIARGLLTCMGLLWNYPGDARHLRAVTRQLSKVERHLFHDDPAVWRPAAWTWVFVHRAQEIPLQASSAVLDRLLALWLRNAARPYETSVALSDQLGLPRRAWTPVLTEAQVQQVRQIGDGCKSNSIYNNLEASLMVAFHAGNVWPEEELATRLDRRGRIGFVTVRDRSRGSIDAMLKQMGEAGQRYLKSKTPRRQKHKPA